MTDTPSQPAEGNSLAQLAAHAGNVAAEAPESLPDEQYGPIIEELDALYHRLLSEAADHYNRARRALDDALSNHRNTPRT